MEPPFSSQNMSNQQLFDMFHSSGAGVPPAFCDQNGVIVHRTSPNARYVIEYGPPKTYFFTSAYGSTNSSGRHFNHYRRVNVQHPAYFAPGYPPLPDALNQNQAFWRI